jgi:hypothetical protein
MRSRHCIFLRPEATDGVVLDIKVDSHPMPQHQFDVEGFKRLVVYYWSISGGILENGFAADGQSTKIGTWNPEAYIPF